jgi:hypothetical protein
MTQLAEPDELVVALQDWAELPDPRVKVTDLPGRADPKAVKVPESVAAWPLVAVVAPV